MASKDKQENDEKSDWKYDGNEAEWDSFDRRMLRWCRKRYGPEIGGFMWRGSMQDIGELHGDEWNHYCEQIWNAIDETNPTGPGGFGTSTQASGTSRGNLIGGTSSTCSLRTTSRNMQLVHWKWR